MLAGRRTVKVAVVGSGLAGLTAAYRLVKGSEDREVEVEVHLFEKADSLGMDSHSISVPIPGQNGKQRIDVPMRSFQGGYYPRLLELYQELGVSFRTADFSYSFSTLVRSAKHSITTTMIYNGDSGRKGISMPSSMLPLPQKPISGRSLDSTLLLLFAHARAYVTFVFSALLIGFFYLRVILLSLPLHLQKTVRISRTSLRIPVWLPTPSRPSAEKTFSEWRDATTPSSSLARYLGLDTKWRNFVADVLVPLFSAVCTASTEDIWNHPAEEFLDYIYLTLGTHHYVVLNGVQDVVHRITASIPPAQIHTSSPIVRLEYHAVHDTSGPTIDIHCPSNRTFRGFSHVIFATQANHAIPLLKTYLDSLPASDLNGSRSLEAHRTLISAQVACLSHFRYCRTIVVNHTDPSLLPSDPRDVRDLNLVTSARTASGTTKLADAVDAGMCVPPTYAMATHVLPRLAGVFQTTNPTLPPAPHTVLSVARLERAVVTPASKAALDGLWRESAPARSRWWGCAGGDGGVLGPLQGAGALEQGEGERVPGVWVCGSFAHCGIPLLEGCVVSAGNVVEQGVFVSEGL